MYCRFYLFILFILEYLSFKKNLGDQVKAGQAECQQFYFIYDYFCEKRGFMFQCLVFFCVCLIAAARDCQDVRNKDKLLMLENQFNQCLKKPSLKPNPNIYKIDVTFTKLSYYRSLIIISSCLFRKKGNTLNQNIVVNN